MGGRPGGRSRGRGAGHSGEQDGRSFGPSRAQVRRSCSRFERRAALVDLQPADAGDRAGRRAAVRARTAARRRPRSTVPERRRDGGRRCRRRRSWGSASHPADLLGELGDQVCDVPRAVRFADDTAAGLADGRERAGAGQLGRPAARARSRGAAPAPADRTRTAASTTSPSTETQFGSRRRRDQRLVDARGELEHGHAGPARPAPSRTSHGGENRGGSNTRPAALPAGRITEHRVHRGQVDVSAAPPARSRLGQPEHVDVRGSDGRGHRIRVDRRHPNAGRRRGERVRCRCRSRGRRGVPRRRRSRRPVGTPPAPGGLLQPGPGEEHPVGVGPNFRPPADAGRPGSARQTRARVRYPEHAARSRPRAG